jgi:hypothetical protein
MTARSSSELADTALEATIRRIEGARRGREARGGSPSGKSQTEEARGEDRRGGRTVLRWCAATASSAQKRVTGAGKQQGGRRWRGCGSLLKAGRGGRNAPTFCGCGRGGRNGGCLRPRETEVAAGGRGGRRQVGPVRQRHKREVRGAATAVVASDAGRPSKEERRRGENRGRAKKRASRPTGPKGGRERKRSFLFLI